MVGGLAAVLAGVDRRVVALTGLGLLGASTSWKARAARLALKLYVQLVVDGPDARFLFENRTDPLIFGLDAADTDKVTIVGGAGVDPQALGPSRCRSGRR